MRITKESVKREAKRVRKATQTMLNREIKKLKKEWNV